MAKIEFKGINTYISDLNKLESKSIPVIKQAVFEGAKVVADTVNTNIQALPGGLSKPLGQGFGISPMKNDGGFINVKIGFDGYYLGDSNKYANRNKGKGIPIPLIARAVESGTSDGKIRKTPFVRPAVNTSRNAAEAAMQKKINEEIEKIMK